MPLKLIPPREGRSPNYTIRGTYLGVSVDRSSGTGDKRLAGEILKQERKDIEAGKLKGRESDRGPTFDAAALAYMKAGGERRFLDPLLVHFGTTPLAEIDQAAIDAAALAIYPHGTPATRNRQVYTPVAAVARYADPAHAPRLRRPKQPPGRVRWIEPAVAHKLVAASCDKLRPLVVFLLGTGCRLGEALRLDWDKVALDRNFAWIPKTKNGKPRGVHLPEEVVVALANIEGREGSVFGYRDRWRVYDDFIPACRAIKLTDFTPHDCRHTWATWMRQYGGMDLRGLLDTGAWDSIHSVLRYQHVAAGESAKAANKLPLAAKIRGKSVDKKVAR